MTLHVNEIMTTCGVWNLTFSNKSPFSDTIGKRGFWADHEKIFYVKYRSMV